ncbi:hypothetical protein [Sphingorhabdus lutea]|nr:hypothetical protein [Sphingorhabdus lutea]
MTAIAKKFAHQFGFGVAKQKGGKSSLRHEGSVGFWPTGNRIIFWLLR